MEKNVQNFSYCQNIILNLIASGSNRANNQVESLLSTIKIVVIAVESNNCPGQKIIGKVQLT